MSDGYEPPTNDDGFDPYEGLTDLTGEEPLPPLEDPRLPPATPPRSPLLTGLILGLLLVVLSIAIFNLTRDDETSAATEPTSTSAAATDTTAVDDTAADTTEGTSPTESSTTTSAAPILFDPYPAVGNPLLPADLKLETGGLGTIRLGTAGAEAVGMLVASLGEPTSDTGPVAASDEYGANCSDRQMRVVKFGALAAIVIIDADETETFAGYRLDLTYDGASTSVAADLETLSGLKLGNSVVDLKRIYDGFDVQLVNDPALGRIFELRSGNTGNLLLWGPVTDTGNEGTDTIAGIYSVDASVGFC